MKEKIFEFIHSLGIEKCGVSYYDGKSAIVCLFPYFTGFEDGNLSLYARSYDYHKVINEKLSAVCDFIRTLAPDCCCDVFADIGPEVDRHLAYEAGLGFYGKNHMLINDDFGSWFFIGYILCDLNLTPDTPIQKKCIGCNRCIEKCPGGALGEEFDISKCASHISQKKGELTETEIAILKKSALIFGCDMCQRVCPHNNITPKPMKEFTEDLIPSLNIEDIETLSNKEFMRKYKNRAFSWRGKSVVLRNLNIFKCFESK
ncbi:MAG: DUF1730 domain-containing protein [Ruminococcaceae bacterium]|nr:DUF1730 domain-containing protein [Oscillospiraceae bacterium]